MSSRAWVVFVASPNRATSDRLAKLLVGRKLAACVNILPSVRSLYWWKGKMERAREELLVIKSRKSHWPQLSKAIREHHPYEVCEILALPVAQGDPDYLKWIGRSLR
ncbi:MAG TPA: divalent-cation tolerance protein CutA [bacterium]|nr:divalent-cation tolerance protein CutA [bacterium]